MKVLNFITHPNTIIISFFAILINGEGFGGFFLIYLLLGLPYGAAHSLLSLLGIGLLLFVNYKYKRSAKPHTARLVEIVSVLLLLFSLFLFFYNDKQHYNYGTFYKLVPMIMLILFVTVAIVSIAINIAFIFRNSQADSL